MINFDPFLDFYGSWVKKEEINANLKEQIERSEFPKGLIEIEAPCRILPPIDQFAKCFEWVEFTTAAYNHYLPRLYSGDFVYFNCLHAPTMEQSQFGLYCFLCQLHEKGIYWYLLIPAIDWRLKEFYVHDFHVEDIFIPNPKGKELKHLDVRNY